MGVGGQGSKPNSSQHMLGGVVSQLGSEEGDTLHGMGQIHYRACLEAFWRGGKSAGTKRERHCMRWARFITEHAWRLFGRMEIQLGYEREKYCMR